MIIPPVFIYIRIRDDNEKFKLFLPLPVFLLIPIFLLIAVLLAPILLVLALVYLGRGWGVFAFKFPWYLYVLYCSLRGLKIDVQGQKATVSIRII